jgi:hypothetical protein
MLVCELFEATNRSPIGRGFQSIAYPSSQSNRVVKKVRVTSKGSPYLRFLKLAMENSNVFFPKVYHVKLLSQSRNGLFAIVQMERLQEISPRYTNAMVAKSLGIIQWWKTKSVSRHSLLEQVFNNIKSIPFDSPDSVLANCTNPRFKHAMLLLDPLFEEYGNDLHPDNFMMRGDQLVIIDPFPPLEEEAFDPTDIKTQILIYMRKINEWLESMPNIDCLVNPVVYVATLPHKTSPETYREELKKLSPIQHTTIQKVVNNPVFIRIMNELISEYTRLYSLEEGEENVDWLNDVSDPVAAIRNLIKIYTQYGK